jgi:AAA+ ATPase superfamily predicted ATPase
MFVSMIIGRKQEVEILNNSLISDKSELIVVYGRRRVGKTFLIRQLFEKQLKFEVTGLYGGDIKDQLNNFSKELKNRTKNNAMQTPNNWMDAFSLLEAYLNSIKEKNKKVIFIDEFPWIATQKSKFLMAFENFWNSYATKRTDLIVVICGSAASYMVQKIIKNKGGLHNRISQKIRLLPFNLNETQLFLKSRNINYTEYDIVQLYMVMGGIPHYLEKIKKGDSVAQNVDRLCFSKDGMLHDEFNQLYASLFDDSTKHLAIINALAVVKKGIPRKLLAEKSMITSGGDFTLKLEELIESGFVSEYAYYGNKVKQTLYRLSDEYSLFYLKYIKDNKNNGVGVWQQLANTSSYNSWSGFSFESVCLKHIGEIKKGLGIQVIYSTNSSWYNDNAQIDLVIDRADNVINICELKFSQNAFTITKNYHQNLKKKLNEFKVETKTRKNVFLTMVTTFGVEPNEYSLEIMENELTLNCLFGE